MMPSQIERRRGPKLTNRAGPHISTPMEPGFRPVLGTFDPQPGYAGLDRLRRSSSASSNHLGLRTALYRVYFFRQHVHVHV